MKPDEEHHGQDELNWSEAWLVVVCNKKCHLIINPFRLIIKVITGDKLKNIQMSVDGTEN